LQDFYRKFINTKVESGFHNFKMEKSPSIFIHLVDLEKLFTITHSSFSKYFSKLS